MCQGCVLPADYADYWLAPSACWCQGGSGCGRGGQLQRQPTSRVPRQVDQPRLPTCKLARPSCRYAENQVTWVPHPWLLAAAALKLRYFLEKGPALNLITDGTLAARGDDMADPTISNVMEEAEAANGHQSSQHKGEKDKNAWLAAGPAPDVDAESSVPVAWSVSRVA
jgi:hypothetical protein